jgi:hypothetical protein
VSLQVLWVKEGGKESGDDRTKRTVPEIYDANPSERVASLAAAVDADIESW